MIYKQTIMTNLKAAMCKTYRRECCFFKSVIHISSVVHEHLEAGSTRDRKLWVVLPIGAGFIYSYRLDTYEISVAFLSYQEGILHVYSLPQSSSCEMEKKTCTAIISGLEFYTNILHISTNKQQCIKLK